MLKLQQKPSSQSWDNLNEYSNGDQDGMTFSTTDFFDRFVRSANEKGILKTPLPTPLSKHHIFLSSVQLLQAARLDKRDVVVQDDNFGGIIWLAPAALTKIQRYLNEKLMNKAAIMIQKVWRGYTIRKMVPLHSQTRIEAQLNNKSYFQSYITALSHEYSKLCATDERISGPTEDILKFMKKLNRPETLRVSSIYLPLLINAGKREQLSTKHLSLNLKTEHQSTLSMYQDYAPKVLNWISVVLKTKLKERDLLNSLRSGDVLCQLICAMYPGVECNILAKGVEYSFHKIIFFLEMCISMRLKRSLLFQLADILCWPVSDPYKKHGLIVLRTVVALEKHARKTGWKGTPMNLKQGVQKLKSVPEEITLELGARSSSMHNNNTHQKRENGLVEGNRKFETSLNNISKSTEEKHSIGAIQTNGDSSVMISLSSTPNSDQKLENMKSLNHEMVIDNDNQEDTAMNNSESHEETTFNMPNDSDELGAGQLITSSDKIKQSSVRISQNLSMKSSIPDMNTESSFQKPNSDNFVSNLQLRNDQIAGFIEKESHYIQNMQNIVEYLTFIINRKLGIDKTECTRKNSFSSMIPTTLAASLATDVNPMHDESEISYKLRLQGEVEEIKMLQQKVRNIIFLHTQLLKDLKSSWNEKENVYLIGRAITQFSKEMNHVYTTYAVTALANVNKAHLAFESKSEAEYMEFECKIINKLVFKMQSKNCLGIEQPTEWDWIWYLKRPLHRLGNYSAFFESSELQFKSNWAIEEDNRKLKIAAVKLKAAMSSITSYLLNQ